MHRLCIVCRAVNGIASADPAAYLSLMAERAFPVRKMLTFTDEQWEQVRKFRFANEIETENEAVRQLIDLGLQASKKRTK